ncbi:serine protease [Streptomonospora sp. PA3]|uniref:SSI family serine proteinase inhibitor n=1 Tax=Streptomonospora sp. PA3 TaxID=2607326 RepID=UPI0012DE81B0|nr:SSI family serine proteinase inhibitor [Streptomonospora sp. PA3]MUL43459.1 serine protease [Streptomonospora sp. PA3]
MRNRRTPVLLAVLTGLLALSPGAHAAAGAPAAAATTGGRAAQVPDAVLRLSVAATEEKRSDSTTLHCRPAGGSHPRAEDACAALERAEGDFSALGERSQQTTMCTLQYAPVRVSASGVWQGAPVDYSETFSNPCVARAETAGVFDFGTADAGGPDSPAR